MHDSLIGTVVGSELFNMLCICGASALFAPSLMILDWRILVREISFYAISLGLLQLCLFDHKVEDWQALMLLGAYVFYVIVCSQYGKFVTQNLIRVTIHIDYRTHIAVVDYETSMR
jgi:Ca2+/Na+ antiporter